MTARDIAVIKCGGHASVTPAALCADLAELTAGGQSVVVVHGGSADIERLGARLNVPMRRLTAPDGVSGRYTDAATLEVVTLALAGAVRPRLVTALLAVPILLVARLFFHRFDPARVRSGSQTAGGDLVRRV
ncbi:MAG: hypothetical protein ACRDNF_13700, partial [Streptosporangiaceae bacterium]